MLSRESCVSETVGVHLAGLPGMCTLHANSAREAVVKMCTLPLLAGENIGTAFVVPTVAASVDLVVHVGTDASGQRRVREIVAVPGRAENGVIETADVFTTREGRLVRADGYPPHPEEQPQECTGLRHARSPSRSARSKPAAANRSGCGG